jgi:WXG100 family type VII secretion target
MAQRILVTPEQLDQVAGQFKSTSEQSQQMISRLAQQVNGLQGQWDGMTKQRFFQDFQAAQKQMNTYVQLLESINAELKGIATRFRQADQA